MGEKALHVCKTLRRPRWKFLAGCGWGDSNVGEVIAIRYEPGLTVLATASKHRRINPIATRLTVEFMDGVYFRHAERIVDRALFEISESSVIQYWGRMITEAQGGKKCRPSVS